MVTCLLTLTSQPPEAWWSRFPPSGESWPTRPTRPTRPCSRSVRQAHARTDGGPAWTRRAGRLASAASAWRAGIVGAARRPQRRVRASQTLALAQRRLGQVATFPCATIGRSQMAPMRNLRARCVAGQLVRCRSRREMAATPLQTNSACASHCANPPWRACSSQGRRRTRAPIAALCTAAACYGTGLEARCRGAIGTQARAMAERCCRRAWGVEPTVPTA